MTGPRNPDRLIEAFFDDGTDLLPDWAYDEVRHDIHRTRQRGGIAPWATPDRSTLARYAVIAAALVLLVGAGGYFLRSAPLGIVGAPSPTPAPRPTPSPTPVPNAVGPGPVQLVDGEWGLTLTIPDGAIGWAHVPGESAIEKSYGPNGEFGGPAIVVWAMTGTYVDPCTDHTLKQPAPQGVEQLIADLGNQPGISAGPATDVTISGYAGQYVETTITADITSCGDRADEDDFWLWASGGDRRYVQETGEINRMYALDVEGRIFTFDVRLPTTTTDADRAEVSAMLESLVIDAPAPRPSAVGSVPGNLRLSDGDWAMTVDVPAGWTRDGDNGITKPYGPNGELAGPALRLERIAGTVVNPCTDHTRLLPDPTTVDGLVAALARQAGTTAAPSVADIAVDGYAGKGFELVVATDILTCTDDELWLWATANRGARVAEDSAEVNHIQVLDVNDELFTYVARLPARTTEADRRELEGILSSIDIVAPAPPPSPSPSP